MRRLFVLMLALVCVLVLIPSIFAQSIAQFRGPDRNGVFPETGLLKSWPEAGPALLWAREDLDRGFASVAVADEAIYVAGMDSRVEYLTVLDLKGETLWQTESLGTESAFVSPILCEFGGKKIIVGVLVDHIIGVDAEDGSTLWTVKYHDIETPTFHEWAPKNNCVTPLYEDGYLFVTSGYDHVGVMFHLVDGGNGVEQLWVNKELDNHHGQVVKIGSYIYGSNWIDNSNGNWCCVHWETGETMYETTWQTKGSVTAADGMLYCYEEKRGNLALVKPTPDDFEIVSSFRVTQESGPHWTQPVLHKGVLFIRHGNALMAYDVKQ